MFRAVVDATRDAKWLDDETAEDVFLGLAQTFRELANCVDAFGQVVREETDPAMRTSTAAVQALGGALEGLREARTRLDDLLMVGGPPELLELHAVVLSTVKRLLREMDLEERIRRQVGLLRATRARPRRPGEGEPGGRPPRPAEPAPDAETQLMPRLPDDRRGRPRP
jgi:hypothetical protein